MVQEHTNRVLRGEFFAARRLEYKWAESIIAEEKVGASGMGTHLTDILVLEALSLRQEGHDLFTNIALGVCV
jgi:hypothetical protein